MRLGISLFSFWQGLGTEDSKGVQDSVQFSDRRYVLSYILQSFNILSANVNKDCSLKVFPPVLGTVI